MLAAQVHGLHLDDGADVTGGLALALAGLVLLPPAGRPHPDVRAQLLHAAAGPGVRQEQGAASAGGLGGGGRGAGQAGGGGGQQLGLHAGVQRAAVRQTLGWRAEVLTLRADGGVPRRGTTELLQRLERRAQVLVPKLTSQHFLHARPLGAFGLLLGRLGAEQTLTALRLGDHDVSAVGGGRLVENLYLQRPCRETPFVHGALGPLGPLVRGRL